jgi:hypothetical protein
LLLAIAQPFVAAQHTDSANIVEQVRQKIGRYLTSLADVHCTETVTQEKLGPNGHVERTERAKYDYLIMMEGDHDDFKLNETRVELAGNKSKLSPVSMLVSNGIATAMLVFHPYYRDSFKFEVGAEEPVGGKNLIAIHFEHIAGRRTPAALALRGREYPLELQGTAWVDKQSDEVVRIDASLLKDMSDIGLRALKVQVDYKPEVLQGMASSVNLPALAIVDVTTLRQHWRNVEAFNVYKSFSANAEQDPNVKIHAEGSKDEKEQNNGAGTTKEKQ